MKISKLLSFLLGSFLRTYAVDPDDLSNADRGDDFTPTGPDAHGADDDPDAGTKPPVKAEKADPADPADPDPKKVTKAEKADSADPEPGDDSGKEKKEPKKDTRVPLARHEALLNAERERREAVERELAASRRAGEVADAAKVLATANSKVSELEKQYEQLLKDGKHEEALAASRELRAAEREAIQAESRAESKALAAQAYEQMRYSLTLERIEESYPALNPDHADYDKAVAGEVLELAQAYTLTGKYTAADALKKAVKKQFPPATTRQEKAVETDVRVDPDEVDAAAKKLADKTVAKARDGDKGRKAVEQTPPTLGKAGQNHDTQGGKLTQRDVMTMPYDKFSKLTEHDLADLRGDDFVPTE